MLLYFRCQWVYLNKQIETVEGLSTDGFVSDRKILIVLSKFVFYLAAIIDFVLFTVNFSSFISMTKDPYSFWLLSIKEQEVKNKYKNIKENINDYYIF